MSKIIIRCNYQQATSVGVIEKKPKRDRKPQEKSKLDRRLRSICIEIDDGIVKAGIRMAVGDNKNADFEVKNYSALTLKHPQRKFALFWTQQMSINFHSLRFSSTKVSCPSTTIMQVFFGIFPNIGMI